MRWAVISPVAALAMGAVAVSASPGRSPRSSAGGSPSHDSPPVGDVAAADEPHTFRCGSASCDPRRSYCETINTDVQSLPSTYACRPLPVACHPRVDGQPLDCHCFPERTRCDFCNAPPTRGAQEFYRTCFGGR